MKRHNTTTLLGLLFVLALLALATGCREAEVPQGPPNPGFRLIGEFNRNGVMNAATGANTTGQWKAENYFAEPYPSGDIYHFDLIHGSGGGARCEGCRAPALWILVAKANWLECNGQLAGADLKPGKDNYVTCFVIRGTFGPSALPNSIDVTGAAVQMTITADGIDTTYGMPTLQFYNQYGTLTAQTQASGVASNGYSMVASSNCLHGLPTGSYMVSVLNATPDGIGQLIGNTSLYLYGGPVQKVIDDPGFFVSQQYRDFYNREPNSNDSNWQYWTDYITQCGNDATCHANRRAEASMSFWYSAEFLQNHPGLRNPAGVSPDFVNEEFVRMCYAVYLRRDPDPEGWNTWTNLINSNNDYRAVIRGFLESTEYRTSFDPPTLVLTDPPPKEIDDCENGGVRTAYDYSTGTCMNY